MCEASAKIKWNKIQVECNWFQKWVKRVSIAQKKKTTVNLNLSHGKLQQQETTTTIEHITQTRTKPNAQTIKNCGRVRTTLWALKVLHQDFKIKWIGSSAYCRHIHQRSENKCGILSAALSLSARYCLYQRDFHRISSKSRSAPDIVA